MRRNEAEQLTAQLRLGLEAAGQQIGEGIPTLMRAYGAAPDLVCAVMQYVGRVKNNLARLEEEMARSCREE